MANASDHVSHGRLKQIGSILFCHRRHPQLFTFRISNWIPRSSLQSFCQLLLNSGFPLSSCTRCSFLFPYFCVSPIPLRFTLVLFLILMHSISVKQICKLYPDRYRWKLGMEARRFVCYKLNRKMYSSI